MSALGFPLGSPLGGELDVVVTPIPSPSVSLAIASSVTAPPRDILLDADGDLDLSTGDLQLTTGKAAIAQSLDIGYGLVQGEWYLDLDTGLDLFGTVLVNNPNDPAIQDELTRVAMETDGVLSVNGISMSLDRATRVLTAEITVSTSEGALTQVVRLAA